MPPDVVAQEVGQRDEPRTEQRIAQSCGEICVAEYPEDDRGHLNLERSVHPRRMNVVGAENPGPSQEPAGAVGQPPSIMEMDGLVVVHRSAAELEQAQAKGGKHHSGESQIP